VKTKRKFVFLCFHSASFAYMRFVWLFQGNGESWSFCYLPRIATWYCWCWQNKTPDFSLLFIAFAVIYSNNNMVGLGELP
jgi:hypothetical protein